MFSLIAWRIINYCKLCNSWRISKLNLQKSLQQTFLKYSLWELGVPVALLRSFTRLMFSKNYFWLFDVFLVYLNYGESPCYLFLLFRTFYAWLFMFDSLEEYSLATDKKTSFTCFKSQHYTRKSKFYLFSMVENLAKPRITKSRKNVVFLSVQNN